MKNLPPLSPEAMNNLMMQQDVEFLNDLKKKENEALKKLFAGKIKQNFLIAVKDKIINNPNFITIVSTYYNLFDLSQEAIMRGKESVDLDVCKFITMYHFFNTCTLDDGKRAVLQEDNDYVNKLCEQVIEAIKLRVCALMYNSRDSLEGYYPLTYSLFALNNYLFTEFENCMRSKILPNKQNPQFKSNMQYKMLKKVKAILVLVDNSLIEEAYNPLRSLFEIYMVHLTLYDCDKETVERYCRFIGYQMDYQSKGTISEEVEQGYKELKQSGCKLHKTDYLNFGWMDSVLDKYIEKSKRKYKLADLADFLDMKHNSKIGTRLYKCFRECSPLSHGFTGYLEFYTAKQSLCERLCYIMELLTAEFHEDYNLDMLVNGIDVYSYMKNFYDKQLEYDKVIFKDDALYESLNKRYVNRIR